MSNYSVLKQDINNNIYENQTQQITGTVLNAILNEMTASLGAGYQFAGVATLGMNPGDPDQRVFYLAGEGIYTSFGGLQVPAGKLGVLKWDNRWTLQTIDGLGGGGANLTGYVSVASTDDLPDEGVATLGYLCGENLYLYVGEGGDTKEGKYQNCGSFRGPQGDSVQDVEQTQTSLENGGVNKIKFTLSNGVSCEFQVRNGTTSSGLFPTVEALQAAYPSPVVGQYAFVGAGFPADIYVCTTAGTWSDSGEDYDGDNVDLTDYATKAEVNQLEAEKLDKTAAEDTFYITDSNGNIIAQIDNAGVSSVDVKVKVDGVLVSVKSLISSLSGNISTVAGSVATEKARAETEEAKKLDHTLTDDALVIADSNGNIIAKIDAGGVSSPDVLVCVDGNLVSVKTLLSKKIDKELADDSLEIMDSNGYVIFKIDASGAHSAKDKHAVACMVLGEYYYPTATPTRDTNGNITHVAVMFGTGVAGTLDITYTDGNASQVVVEYGDYTYTISILRDAQGNVETVTVN